MATLKKKRVDTSPSAVAAQVQEILALHAQGEQAVARALLDGTLEINVEGVNALIGSRELKPITFRVEKRWIEEIKRIANLDHMTITQVVNEAFRHCFERK